MTGPTVRPSWWRIAPILVSAVLLSLMWVSSAPRAFAAVSNSQNLPPIYTNWPIDAAYQPDGNWPCPATESYTCTKNSGYDATSAQHSGWPWDSYGGTSNASYNSGPHNCTLYAAFRIAQNNIANTGNLRVLESLGNASQWAVNAANHFLVNQTPAVGAIAQWNVGGGVNQQGQPLGHVAYVESVGPGNTGITISEDNFVPASAPNFPGGYTAEIHITNGSPVWPANFIHFSEPAPTPSPAIATAVAAHSGGYCAVLKSQQVECWGLNQFGLLDGMLGDGGSEPSSYVPVYVKGLAGAKSLDNDASILVCAVLMTGRVECWGSNQSGMLGNGGTEASSNTPVAVRNISDARSVFTFENGTTCAILTTGHVDCWGYNAQGQLGDGGTKSSGVPVAVHGITDATSLSGGVVSTCALLGSGGVDCWGANNYGSLAGQLGDGGHEAYSYVPVAVHGIKDAKVLFGSGVPYCAVLATGAVDCWGNQVDGVSVTSDVPVAIGGITHAKSGIVGNGVECVLLTTGGVDCWGSNSNGELGNGVGERESTTPVGVRHLTNAASIASDVQTICALRTTGAVACWGVGSSGELGNGSTSLSSPVPVAARGLSTAVALTSGTDGFCALLASGGVDCWGTNFTQKPRGPRSLQYSTIPVPVAGLGS